MKNIKKVGILVLLFLSMESHVVAKEIVNKEKISKESEKYLETTREITGDVVQNAAKGKEIDDKRGGYFDNYMDTVIWNDSHTRRTDNIAQEQRLSAGKESIVLDTPVDKLQELWDKEEAMLAHLKANESNKTKKIPTMFAGGYCTLEETLRISKANVFGKLDCMLDFGKGEYRRAEVFTGFYPDYKREMVIAIPVYMTFENGNRATLSGIVLKGNKTSMNMAGWVDNRRLQKMLGEGLLVTNDIIYKYASGYMDALMQSRVQEDVVYPPNEANGSGGYTGYGFYSGATKIRNVAPPEARDYIITAGISILSNIFAITGKDYLYSKEPLFAVYPQKVYVEGMVSFDNQGLAQRFGQISQSRQNSANMNNQEWMNERNQIINRSGKGQTTGKLIQ